MIHLSKGLRAALFAAALGSSLNLYALNGAQLVGFSATTASMGGAGAAAAPQEGSVMITNPAGLTEVPRGVGFNFLLGFPRSQANTSAATLGNTVGNQVSNDDPVILPSGNAVVPFLDDRLHVGVGAFQIAGFGNDYAQSPAAPGTTGNNYSTHSLFGLLKIVTAAAYEYSEKLSIGLGIHVNQQQLESNSAVLPTLTQTTGIDRSDRSFGAGAGIGVLYKLSKLIHLGVSYTSEQFMNEFSRYQDLFPRGLNYPQQANIGAAFYPIEGLLAAADFRWINWSGAHGGFGDPQNAAGNGGLGWQDQFIGMVGAQYQLLSNLKLRSGFNFSRSAVPARAAFTNALSTAVAKYHVGGGFSFEPIKDMLFDFSYLRTINSTKTDNGAHSALGTGAVIAASGHEFNFGLGVRF